MIRAMPAPRRYERMTAGPARRMVTLLPKNKPTPMAPPMAIMVSCLWLRRRWRPSISCVGGFSPASVASAPARWGSIITADTGRVEDHQIDIRPENFYDRLYIVHRVVYMERYPQPVV